MKYLKVFTDFGETIDPLSDDEAGRLFRAMLAYAERQEQPELIGNERFLWNAARQNIDKEIAFCLRQAENGRKGGRPKAAEAAENTQGGGAAKTRKTQKEKDKDKDNDKDSLKEALSEESGKKAGFLPPTLEEIRAYCSEKGLKVDAERFLRFYTEAGWRDSHGKPVRNWKLKLLSWDGRNREAASSRKGVRKGMGADAPYEQTFISDEEFDSFFEIL